MRKIFDIVKFILKEKTNKKERFRRLFYGIGWQLWKRIIKKPIIIKLDNGANFISFPNSVMGSFPIYAKIYDSEKILFVRSFLKNKGIMLDIGANQGIYSLLLRDYISKTLLFEPIPQTVKRLKMNMCLNDIDNQIYDIALSDKIGEIYMEFKIKNDTVAKISQTNNGLKVDMNKLDNILTDDILKNIEFVKIDVEGNEYNVLRGATKLLKESSTRLIQFERLKKTPIEPILELFNKYNWKVFALNKNGVPDYERKAILNAHDLFAKKIVDVLNDNI